MAWLTDFVHFRYQWTCLSQYGGWKNSQQSSSWQKQQSRRSIHVGKVRGLIFAQRVPWNTIYYIAVPTTHHLTMDCAKSFVGLGYYSRASRLLSGAKKVVQDFGGILPDDPSIMESQVDGMWGSCSTFTHLGVTIHPILKWNYVSTCSGPYSAGAIASIAYNKPAAMIDGNVHRVLTRMLPGVNQKWPVFGTSIDRFCPLAFAGLTAFHSTQTSKSTTNFLWSVAQSVVPNHRPGDFNQALMELGATVCKPRASKCEECPLTGWCKAYQEVITSRW